MSSLYPNSADAQSEVRAPASSHARHSFVSSSCGACGKQSIAAIGLNRRFPTLPGSPAVTSDFILRLPETLRLAQTAFSRTGGTHASGLFDLQGNLRTLHEDVGRHNALDKVIGTELLERRVVRVVREAGQQVGVGRQRVGLAGDRVQQHRCHHE